MANDLKVSANPIQRNRNDVALELTKLHLMEEEDRSVENIQLVYSKFYAIARSMELLGHGDEVPSILSTLVPKEISQIRK